MKSVTALVLYSGAGNIRSLNRQVDLLTGNPFLEAPNISTIDDYAKDGGTEVV